MEAYSLGVCKLVVDIVDILGEEILEVGIVDILVEEILEVVGKLEVVVVQMVVQVVVEEGVALVAVTL